MMIEKIQETIAQELKVHQEKQEQLVHKDHQAPKVILVQPGARGPQGIQGERGEQGKQG